MERYFLLFSLLCHSIELLSIGILTRPRPRPFYLSSPHPSVSCLLSLSTALLPINVLTSFLILTHNIFSPLLGDRGEAIFKGRIRIPQHAQLTDSDQICRTIMLGDRARIIAMPTLEITADNVVCRFVTLIINLKTVHPV